MQLKRRVMMSAAAIAISLAGGAMTTVSTAGASTQYTRPGGVASIGTQCLVGVPKVPIPAGDAVGVTVVVKNRATGQVMHNGGWMYPAYPGWFYQSTPRTAWYQSWTFPTNSYQFYDVQWTFNWFHNGANVFREQYWSGTCGPSQMNYVDEYALDLIAGTVATI